MISEHISHYRIIKSLGAGAIGEVYLARDIRLDRLVAIKFLRSETSADEETRRRLVRVAMLSHPNIPAILEVGQENELIFIVMQHVEGEALSARMREGTLILQEVLDVAVQVTAALAAAHSQGIIHRDIKPENIMILPSGRAMVMDFGLTKGRQQRQISESEAGNQTLTSASGATVGSVPYMSPEQVRGEILDARSDIFSLGVVIYEMVAGRVPFLGSGADTVAAILHQEPASLARSNAPIELQRIIDKALSKTRDERYQTTTQLLNDLRELREEMSLEAVRAPFPASPAFESMATLDFAWMPARMKNSVQWVVLVVGASLAAVLFGQAFFSGPPYWRHDHGHGDGDPPNMPAAIVTRTSRKVIDDAINKLTPGRILFDPSPEMKVGNGEKVEIRIAKSFTGDLTSGLKGRGRPEIEDISVGSYMGVTLKGTDGFFNIDLKNRQEKIVRDGHYTEWVFDVTPLKAGAPSLYLTAYVVIDTPAGQRAYEPPAFVKEIKVTTTAVATVSSFLTNNWDKVISALLGTGLIGLGARWVVSKKKSMRKSRPWEVP